MNLVGYSLQDCTVRHDLSNLAGMHAHTVDYITPDHMVIPIKTAFKYDFIAGATQLIV